MRKHQAGQPGCRVMALEEEDEEASGRPALGAQSDGPRRGFGLCRTLLAGLSAAAARWWTPTGRLKPCRLLKIPAWAAMLLVDAEGAYAVALEQGSCLETGTRKCRSHCFPPF